MPIPPITAASHPDVYSPEIGKPIEGDPWGKAVAQSVIHHFANAGDRDAAIPNPDPGTFVWIGTWRLVMVWDGTAWAPVGVPPGTIIDIYTLTIPAGYLHCNGQAVPTGTYLRDVLGVTATPALHDGRFTRGVTTPVGGVGGSANAVLVYHSHGGATNWDDRDHSHNIQHGHDSGGFNKDEGYGYRSPSGAVNAGGWGAAADPNVLGGWYRTTPHVHNGYTNPANSGGRSTGHLHGVHAEGVSAAGANLPPYVDVLKVIKL